MLKQLISHFCIFYLSTNFKDIYLLTMKIVTNYLQIWSKFGYC